MSDRTTIAIIGGGPAGLIAAEVLADRAEVDLYEGGRAVGRKFLVAGYGGLNITNRAEGDRLLEKYSDPEFFRPVLAAFGPTALREWLAGLGISTFTGSSGRVFPERGIRPAQVLKAIRDSAVSKGARIHVGHEFVGFDEGARPILEHAGERSTLDTHRTLFALGGASWSRTGSKGDWRTHFEGIGVHTVPFQASNCGVEIPWPAALAPHFGKPLKNIRITAGGMSLRGEATITAYGLEGNGIYPLVPELRAALAKGGQAIIGLDLKPDVDKAEMERRLRGAAWRERMAALKLDRVQVALLKAYTSGARFVDGSGLVDDLKDLKLTVTALRPIEEAISTVGGIALEEVAPDLSLKRHPHLSVAGEMLDWDAPTGGFLLQGAFALGRWAALGGPG